ncbi:hypothetical protein ETB97_003180 [Aspergillus alliaceus]|uniref:Ankyrin repeat protein n=1 Tax=Petromyces alliaceus TaxID=209559 RepID=A0A8H6A252_PETAA|nr:hypothetical protein ETB97_003180 [Aspergillus burnettii]
MEDFLETNDDMDGQGSSALGAASTSSLSWETVKRTNKVFLENGDDINFIEATIPDSTNKYPGFDRPCALPLYDFASAGSIIGAKLLLEHGADPTAKGLSGRRPMHAVLDANDLDPALAERIFTIMVRASDEQGGDLNLYDQSPGPTREAPRESNIKFDIMEMISQRLRTAFQGNSLLSSLIAGPL